MVLLCCVLCCKPPIIPKGHCKGGMSKVYVTKHESRPCECLLSVLFSREGFTEHCVMNNYFSVGIDAKIALAFHLKREENPEQFRYLSSLFINFLFEIKDCFKQTRFG